VKPFVVYSHMWAATQWAHVPFTGCWAATIEEGVDAFCLLTHLRFPDLHAYHFCIQEVERGRAEQAYTPIHRVLSVTVQEANAPCHRTLVWDADHEQLFTD
jgi:hypothetical protein